MGVVYGGDHALLEREVAVKVLSRAHAQEEKHIQRFFREGRAACKIEHPNLIKIHDLNREGSFCYIVMELIEGASLDKIVETQGPLTNERSSSIIRTIAEVMAKIHSQNVVHRDLKPSNIMVTKQGHVKLTDFGLARIFDEESNLTRTGQILGTPHFMSPEQGEGVVVDHRSDIYSLGVTWYFFLTGKKPFMGETPIAIMISHIRETPTPVHEIVSNIPQATSKLVDRMMAKKPTDRPPTMAEVVAAIDRLSASPGKTLSQSSGNLPSRARRVSSRSQANLSSAAIRRRRSRSQGNLPAQKGRNLKARSNPNLKTVPSDRKAQPRRKSSGQIPVRGKTRGSGDRNPTLGQRNTSEDSLLIPSIVTLLFVLAGIALLLAR
jgi:serine/threonine-protein kinase